MSVSYGGDSITFADSSVISSAWTGFKNRVINGAMVVDQRVNGGGISSSSWVVDRMLSIERGNYSTLTVTASQSTDAPAGFSKSIKVQIGTAEATSSNKYMNGCDHRIEGYNFADFNFGTANAKTFTLSFWVKSSIVGLYPVSFFNADVNRTYLATYTINSANTWEYKTITVPGDTSGTWNTTNGIGLGWQMSVASGSSNYGTPGSWGTTYRSGVSGQADLGATAGATWYITGMQLEKGSTASSFENRPFGTELQLCQRYFCKSYELGTAPGTNVGQGTWLGTGTNSNGFGPFFNWTFPVAMRASPTITCYAPNGESGKLSSSSTNKTAASFGGARQTANMTTFCVYGSYTQYAEAEGHATASAEL